MEQVVQLLPEGPTTKALSTDPEELIGAVFEWLDVDSSGTIEEDELAGNLVPSQSAVIAAMLGSLPPYDSSSVDLTGFGACRLSVLVQALTVFWFQDASCVV